MKFTANGLSEFFSVFPPELIGIVVAVLALAQLIVVIILAAAVMGDAQRRRRNSEGLFLLSPWMWFFVVAFTGGYLGTLGYWFIHYSAQRYRHEYKG